MIRKPLIEQKKSPDDLNESPADTEIKSEEIRIISSVAFTEQQAELITACVLGGDDANRAFNQSTSLRINGHVSIAALEKALRVLVARHDSLRTVFDISSGCFHILDRMPVEFKVRKFTEESMDIALEEQTSIESEYVFDLQKGPLFRFNLLISDSFSLLVFTIHHLVFDGWTLGITIKEIAELYNTAIDDALLIKNEAVSYAEYARSEQAFTQSREYSEMKNYYLAKLAFYKPCSPLPYDRKRTKNFSYTSSHETVIADQKLYEMLKNLALKNDCSLFVTMLTVFEVLLYRISGLSKILVGVPAAGQPISGFEELSGHCVYLLPVISQMQGNNTFAEQLRQRKNEFARDIENRRVTYGSLLKEIKTDRSAEAVPLIPVTFNIYRELSDEITFNGRETSVIVNPRKYSFFEMAINIRRNPTNLEIDCSFKDTLFDAGTVRELLIQYRELLFQVCRNPDNRLDDFEVLHKKIPVSDNAKYGLENELKRKFNLKLFEGNLTRLEMPVFKNRINVPEGNYSEIEVEFNPDTVAKFIANTKKNGIGSFAACLALTETLLNRYTGQTDIIAGFQAAPGDNDKVDSDEIFAMRSSFSEEDNFSILLTKCENLDSELKIKRYPLNELISELIKTDYQVSSDIFSLLLSVDNDREGLIRRKLKKSVSGFEIVFRYVLNEGEFYLNLTYNEMLFERKFMEELGMNMNILLATVCQDLNAGICSFNMLNDAAFKRLIYRLNATETTFGKDKTLLSLFKEKVNSQGESPAVDDGIENYTYLELDRRSDIIAALLLNLPGAAGQYICVHMDRSVGMVVALLAIFKTGRAYLPLEPVLPYERKKVILDSLACNLIITDKVSYETSRVLSVSGHCILIDDEDNYKANPVADKLKSPSPEDIAYVIFTSGSTGVPKGVMVEHRSLVNVIEWVNKTFGINARDKMLGTASISFDLSVYDIFGILAAGAVLRIARNNELQDPRALTGILFTEGISFWNSAPPVMQQLLPFIKSHKGREAALLRLVFLSGDWIPLSMPGELKSIFKGLEVISLGGATEASIWSNYFQIDEIDADWKSIPYGKPIQNAKYYILNKALQAVPEGVCGDLYIGGEVLARGYNDKDLTSKKIISNPFEQGGRIYQTGDKARFFMDGNIEFLGRSDSQVKIRGYRVELGDIESTIQTYPGVENSVVLVHESPKMQKSLAAYILIAEKPSYDEFRNWLKTKLPVYMVPDHLVFMSEFPLNANGKTDRKKLPYPELNQSISGIDESEILSETELTVCNILKEVLVLEKLSKKDDFFELGGHSLKAIEVILKVEERTAFKLSMAALFTHPSAESLAKLIDNREEDEWKYLVAIRPEGSKPPLYLVHGGGLGVMVFNDLVRHLDAEQPVYGIQAIGLNSDETPGESVESIAEVYLEELIRHNPNGPYLLAGFSAGSVIAFEMAGQLQTSGKKVAFLGNFDFSIENLRQNVSGKEKLKRILPEFIPRKVHFMKNIIRHPKDNLKFQKTFAGLRINGILARLGYTREEKNDAGMEKIHRLMDRYQRAFNIYKPRPYNGKIDLFVSGKKMYYLRDPVWLGWKDYALNGIRIHPVEGDHDHMILEPFSAQFASVLQSVLDENPKSDF